MVSFWTTLLLLVFSYNSNSNLKHFWSVYISTLLMQWGKIVLVFCLGKVKALTVSAEAGKTLNW